jgi:hypothetical protein
MRQCRSIPEEVRGAPVASATPPKPAAPTRDRRGRDGSITSFGACAGDFCFAPNSDHDRCVVGTPPLCKCWRQQILLVAGPHDPLSGGAMPTHRGRRSGQRCLQWRVIPLKPYRGRHPGPRQRKERFAIFTVVSRFRPGKALVRISAHFLWGHDAISFAVMTPPIRQNAYPKKRFDVPWTLVRFVASNLWGATRQLHPDRPRSSSISLFKLPVSNFFKHPVSGFLKHLVGSLFKLPLATCSQPRVSRAED